MDDLPPPLRIAFSATNPCHLWPMARECERAGVLAGYYSGYPAWKLKADKNLPVATHSWRTLVVYGLLKWLPEKWRMPNRSLFLWQDIAFDRWVARNLQPADFIHAMPGQAKETFRRGKVMGVTTVLNHATGPVRQLVKTLAPEFARRGLRVEEETPYDEAYFAREAEEYELSDYHCVASSIVKEALIMEGIKASRILVVPYGADGKIFHPPRFRRQDDAGSRPFRLVFAGMLSLRKGLRHLLAALAMCLSKEWEMHFYGQAMQETDADFASYRGGASLTFHGAVSQSELAGAFRESDALVLPSLEEGFGLVVVQALACGLPCLVSDRVGAKDLIEAGENGDIFVAGDAVSLALTLSKWAQPRQRLCQVRDYGWRTAATTLVKQSCEILRTTEKIEFSKV